MEFNVLPRAKILSPHAINKTNQTTNQTVNVIIPQSENQKPIENISENTPPPPLEPQNPYQNLDSGAVHYSERDVKLNENPEKLSQVDSIATINFLKLVLQSYMNNPIKYNGYVICSVPVLEHLIETITSCDDCDVDFTEIETTCCGNSSTTKIVPITKIWVTVNGNREIFKYKYSSLIPVFEEYNISLKFVYLQ